METDGTFDKITKKEQLHLTRERDKLRKVLEGIEFMNKIPNAIFIVDTKKESIAIREALRLNIPIYAIVDTNCDPDPIDYLIPANDDAVRTIEIILKSISDAVIEGLQKQEEVLAQEKAVKEREKKEREDNKQKKTGKPRVRKVKFDSKGGKKSDKREIKTENLTEENASAKNDDVNNKSKNDDKSEKVNSENVKEKTIQEEKKITEENDKSEQTKTTEEKSTESEKDNEKTENK
jgi:small subunit ribosomal protein S2